MDVWEVWLEDDGHFFELKADVILDIFFEDVNFGIVSILVFAVIEGRL